MDSGQEKDQGMETLPRYRSVITRVLSDLAEASPRDPVETRLIADTTHAHYLVLDAGWQGIQRIHRIRAHLRIHHGKIWMEVDTTDQQLVQQLLDAGIPKEAIVLAFYSPQKRRLTEFAVA
jgi:hypothetical protein